MTDQEMKLYAHELESTLAIAFLPSFLNWVIADGYIHFVISAPIFKKLTINERAALVFSKLKLHDLNILNEVPVIVETYSSKQIEDLIDFFLET